MFLSEKAEPTVLIFDSVEEKREREEEKDRKNETEGPDFWCPFIWNTE